MKVLRGRKARPSILRSAVREEKTANWRAFREDFKERRPDFCAFQTAWRRERDSNPRYGFQYIGFQDRLFQPLTHPSAAEKSLSSWGNGGQGTFWMAIFLRHIGALPRLSGATPESGKRASRSSCPSLAHSLGVTTIEEPADNHRIKVKTNSPAPTGWRSRGRT